MTIPKPFSVKNTGMRPPQTVGMPFRAQSATVTSASIVRVPRGSAGEMV